MNSYDKIAMKKVLIIAPNFPPESVGGASRIFEMAKKIEIKDAGWLRNSFNQKNYFFEGFIIFCGSTNSSKSSPDI